MKVLLIFIDTVVLPYSLFKKYDKQENDPEAHEVCFLKKNFKIKMAVNYQLVYIILIREALL